MALTKKKTAAAAEPAPEAAVEKPVEEKAASKRSAAAKSALKKAAPKKAAAPKAAERVEEVYLQVSGEEWNLSDCKARAAAAYAAEGHRESGIKKLVVYVKPEERKAYYVVNDSVNGSFDL